MKELFLSWKANKLENTMKLCFLATVFASFFGSAILSFSVPGIGELFPFRILLCVTALLYLIWCICGKDPFWKDSSWLEKWCYVFAGIMLIYGTVSLLWAIDFMFSFRKLFNLCFDLCFFFLLLRLCREKKMLKRTILLSVVALAILAIMGVYEIFNGGIFSDKYNVGTWFSLFMEYYQYPLTVSSTCNEYAGTFVFIGAVVLLNWCVNKELPKWQMWIIAIAIPFAWFLMLASNARLCQMAFLILTVGFGVYLLFRDRKKFLVLLVALVLMGGVQFAHQYRYIVPPIQQYMAEMEKYNEQMAALPTATQPMVTQPAVTQPSEVPTIPKPTLNVGNPKDEPIKDQVFKKNEETGEITLNTEKSGGIRVRLLIHAFQCFKESYGLGCGLGNTEQLAVKYEAVPLGTREGFYSSIHCFVARIVADYGIFALIPLCIIAFLLLKKGWKLFVEGVKGKSWATIGLSFFYVCCLLVFPIVSTASADAQDILPMWIYLAMIVLLSSMLHPTCEAQINEATA